MSRIGKMPVDVPSGVTVTTAGAEVRAKGPKGELSLRVPAPLSVAVHGSRVDVSAGEDTKAARSLHGLTRSLIANMVEGVSKGFSKELELQGVGFRASLQGEKLTMTLGYSHAIEFKAPQGVSLAVKDNAITVSGPDKQSVGAAAARIRSFYPPEPYKGKGVRYKGEHVRRKAGKTVA